MAVTGCDAGLLCILHGGHGGLRLETREVVRDDALTAQGRRQAGIPADAQHGDGVPGVGTDNCTAVAAYRLSVQAGNRLSKRKLAQMFGRTSRRWARARITEARQSP